MRKTLVSMGAVALVFALLAPACSSGGGSNGETCAAGFDGGPTAGGTEAVSESGQCGNLLTGTKQNGDACQNDSQCAPTCCACPGSSRSAQVVLCSMGHCVVGADVCCAWLANNSGPDGGAPYVCQTH